MKKVWKPVIILIIAFCTLILTGCGPDAVDSYGKPISLANYKGKWVVINYWATWCQPCINEISALIDLQRYYAQQVVVLGVNPDNLSNDVLQQLGQGYGINYPLLSQFPIEKWGGKPSSSLPVTYIFDAKGKLFQTLLGPQTLSNFQAVMSLPSIVYQ